MSIKTQVNRLNNAKDSLKEWLVSKGVGVSDEDTMETLVSLLRNTSLNADTVDGWHVDVRSDGSEPPSGMTNTISFIYTDMGG